MSKSKPVVNLKQFRTRLKNENPHKSLDAMATRISASRLWHRLGRRGYKEYDAYRLVNEYKRFLFLKHLVDSEDKEPVISPSSQVDEVWHEHILDTRVYFDDCQNLFGHIIHHSPDDAFNVDQRNKRLELTKKLYLECYNEFPPEDYWNDEINNEVIPPQSDTDGMTVIVCMLTGSRKLHKIMPEDTVDSLKNKIAAREGICVDQQRLIHKGTQMADDDTFADYDVRHKDAIHLVLRLRGC